MINDFSTDSSCYAQYQFEEGYLFEDSRRTNTLTNNGVISSTGPGGYTEGYGAAQFQGSQYFLIADASLCDEFPLKWKDSPTLRDETPNFFSTCFWFYPSDTTGTQVLIAKSNEADKQCFELVCVDGALFLLWGYSGIGVAALTVNTAFTFTQGYWYHVGLSISGPDAVAHVRVWNDTSQSIVINFTQQAIGTDIATNDSPLTIGGNYTGSKCVIGILDEVVIFNTERTSVEFDAIRQQFYTGPMQNSFVDDQSCQALYRFEGSELLKDSISTNDLTDYNTVRASRIVGLYMEGYQSVLFNNQFLEYAMRTDANLLTDFPLKSTDTTKTFTICFWFRVNSTSGTQYLISKTANINGQRSFGIYLSGSNLHYVWGYNSGTQSTDTSIGSITANRWYHVGIAFDGGTRPYFIYRVWDGVQRKVVYYLKFHPATSLSVGAAPFVLGATSPAGSFYGGYLDEVVIFSSIKTASEIDAIRAGAYQRQLLPVYVDATGVAYDYFRQPLWKTVGVGVSLTAVNDPQWRVGEMGIMILTKVVNRSLSNRYFSDPNCAACYSFEPDDPGFLVDHVGGNNLTDHNAIEPVQ